MINFIALALGTAGDLNPRLTTSGAQNFELAFCTVWGSRLCCPVFDGLAVRGFKSGHLGPTCWHLLKSGTAHDLELLICGLPYLGDFKELAG